MWVFSRFFRLNFRNNKNGSRQSAARAKSDLFNFRVGYLVLCVSECCCYHIIRRLSYAHLWWNYVNSFGIVSLCNALFGKTIRTDCVFARLLNSIQYSTCRQSYHSSFRRRRLILCVVKYSRLVLQRDIGWQSSLVVCEPQICDQNIKSQNVCVRLSEYVKMWNVVKALLYVEQNGFSMLFSHFPQSSGTPLRIKSNTCILYEIFFPRKTRIRIPCKLISII